MKRKCYFIIIAAVLMTGLLAGCGNEANQTDETDKTATQESLDEESDSWETEETNSGDGETQEETVSDETLDNKDTTEESPALEDQYEVYTSQYTLSSGYTMNIFQVRGMKDKELEDKVNESLNSYLYILVEPWFLPERLEEYEPIIHCQTDRYLSVEYSFKYTTAFKPTTWHYCITVNMQNGEVVFWDDIIDINETFAERIKNDSIIKKAEWEWWYTEEEMIEFENKWFSEREIDYIQRFFNDFTRDYLYGDYYRENGYIMSSWEPVIYNTTFWLEEGKICFTSGSSDYSIDWLMLDDIEDFLKVPKW